MTDEANTALSEGTDAGTQAPAPETRTAEEVDAEWRNRMSQRDKAHNAEAEALRRQLADIQATEDRRRSEADQARLATMSEAERVAAERDQYKQQLEEERRGRVIDTRKARFPNAASELGDEVVAAMDEGKLAALEAKLAGGTTAPPPSLIDPNSAARTNGGSSAPPREQTAEDMKAELARLSPSWVEEVKSR